MGVDVRGVDGRGEEGEEGGRCEEGVGEEVVGVLESAGGAEVAQHWASGGSSSFFMLGGSFRAHGAIKKHIWGKKPGTDVEQILSSSPPPPLTDFREPRPAQTPWSPSIGAVLQIRALLPSFADRTAALLKVLTGGKAVKGVAKVVKSKKAAHAVRKRPAARPSQAVLRRPAAATSKASVEPCLKIPFPGDPTKKIEEETTT